MLKRSRATENDIEEMERKIHAHRMKYLKIISLVVMICLITAAGSYLYLETRTYNSYQVIKTQERKDSVGTNFMEFNGNILKYGNDGAFYIDTSNNLIWNQTYEIREPVIDICEDYVSIAEKNGNKIYIMDTAGACGEITTSMPIQQVHIANQGTVAVLMEENGTGHIQLYGRDGAVLAGGELHTKKGGYPLDITLSNDGRKLAVTMLDINDGSVKTTVAFYNFDSVGQNELDNLVGSFSYESVIPRVEYITNDIMVAFGDTKLILYEGKQRPVVKKEIDVSQEIRSIFYNNNYFSVCYANENKEENFSMTIYDLKGIPVRSIDFSMEYDSIEFLQNDEICLRNNLECEIYTLRGVKRFHYNFEKNIRKVISTGMGMRYVFLMDGTTELVKFKLK